MGRKTPKLIMFYPPSYYIQVLNLNTVIPYLIYDVIFDVYATKCNYIVCDIKYNKKEFTTEALESLSVEPS